MKQTPSVVVDTNIFVVARFKKKGAPKRLMQDCIDGKVKAMYNRKIRDEAYRILPKVGASEIFMERLENYFERALEIKGLLRLKVCQDPQDDMFLECALIGDADYIISHDMHLRRLDGYDGIKVRTASQFYQENNMPRRE